MLRFPFFFFLLERFSFSGGTIVKSVAILEFKACLSVLLFVWAINHVKIDQLSQKLDMFFMEVTLVCTPKTVNVY